MMAFHTGNETGNRDGIIRWPTAGATIALLFLALIALIAFRYSATAAGEIEAIDAGPTESAQLAAGSKRCEFFVLQKILSARDPVVIDHWDVEGKRVFRVGFSLSGKDNRTERLCVYDLENRSALLPAVTDEYQWLPDKLGESNG